MNILVDFTPYVDESEVVFVHQVLEHKVHQTCEVRIVFDQKSGNTPKGVMRGQDMLYMTTMESINNSLAYCSPNLKTR